MKLHRIILLLALFLCTGLQSFASHLMGGSISYDYLGYNASTNLYSYRVTAKIYRYCDSTGTGGTPAQLDQQMSTGIYPQNPFQPNANKSLYTTLTLPLISSAFIVPPSTNPNCTVGNNVCVQEGIYQATINLPPSIGGYHLIIDRCCRNYNIANLNVTTPPGSGAAYYAFIPPTATPNNSPTFATAPVPYICFGDTVSVLNSAFDADGDSLAYSFQVPYKGLSSSNNPNPNLPATYTWPIPNTTYVTGYGLSTPFGPGGYASIDGNTGLTNYYIPNQGFYVVAIEIQEFRNGVLIGVTRRDIQLIVIPCSPNTSPANTSGGGAGTTNYSSDGGAQLCFQIEYTDADGDSLFLDVNGPIFDSTVTNPAATVIITNAPGATNGQFCWNTPCVNSATTFLFTTSATDNGCPPKTTNSVFSIEVNPVLIAGFSGPDTVCGNQGQITYSVLPGASSYGWLVSGGIINGPSNGASVDVTWTDSTGSISVYALNTNGCPSDTLSKSVIAYQTLAIAGNDVSICQGETALLGGSALSGQTYNWSPSFGLDDSTSSNPTVSLTTPGSTTYTLTVSQNGCSSSDQVTVEVNPDPVITFSSMMTFCSSANPVVLNQASPAGGIYSGTGVSNGVFDPSVSGSGAFQIEYSYTDSLGCSSVSNAVFVVHPDPIVSLSNLGTTCVNGAPITLSGGSPAGGTYTGPGITSGQFDPSTLPQGSYTYYYTYVDANGCFGTDSATISIGSAATVTVSAAAGQNCEANTIYIGYGPQSITLTAQASTTGLLYQWYKDGVVIPGATNPTYSATIAGNYSVIVTDAGGCASSASDPGSQIQINTVDVRCGNNNSKVIICHVPPGNSGNPQTLCIAPSAVPAHLNEHDEDCLGPCPGSRFNNSEEAMNETFAVYPNPFGQNIRLTFEVEESQTVEAQILDAAGRKIMSLFDGSFQRHTHFDQTFDVSKLSKGVYILRLRRGNDVEFKKITSNN